jgi:hypothetical protein
VIADGLAHAFRSNQTASFPELLSSLFTASNPDQKAGFLNQFIAAIGPAALANVPGLNELARASSAGQSVTPQRASQISAEQVQQAAAHLERTNPSIIDKVSGFYAQHPGVVKALGSAALTIAIRRIVQKHAGTT